MARVRGRTPRTMTHSRHRYWHFVYTRSSGDASSELDLRASWNNILGRQTTATAAKNLAKNLPAPRAADAAVLDEAKWIRTALHWRRPKRTTADWWCRPIHHSDAYRASARSVARKQIALAGARLASVLNRDPQ